MIGLLIGALDQLPERERKASRQAQCEYLALRTHVLAGVRPGLDTSEAKIVIIAVLTLIDNAARTGRLGRRTHLADRPAGIGTAMLLSGDAGTTP